MANTITILTNYGNNLILQAMASGTTVTITSMVFGDANGATYVPSVEQTALVHQLGNIIDLTKTFDEVEGFYYIKGTLPANTPECTIREIGLTDNTNQLIAISVIPPTSKPALESGLEVTMPISMGFKTSTGEVMVVPVGPGVDYPDKTWVEDEIDIQIPKIKIINCITW